MDFKNIKEMQYPLEERIGEPNLLVGREEEFADFHQWIEMIPRRLSKSRAILARKKCGKTLFVQRLFNQIWSANEEVVPFFFQVEDKKVWMPEFAIDYYCRFATQYISFLERDPALVGEPLTLDEISEYGKKASIRAFVKNVKELQQYMDMEFYDTMWKIAYTLPERLAAVYKRPILVMIDEFQNLGEFIFVNKEKTLCDDSMPGSYHNVSESKSAPMLITGSSVGWILSQISKYLEGGRVHKHRMSPYLTPEHGLEEVYRYAEYYNVPITNETSILINNHCNSDPFFISCVIQSKYKQKDLLTEEGVLKTIEYELKGDDAQLSVELVDYFESTFDRINEVYAKEILLFMTRYSDRTWSPKELKEALQIDLEPRKIHRRLESLRKADLIKGTISNIDYKGHKDGTFYRVLRDKFGKEISEAGKVTDFTKELKEDLTLKRKVNLLQGRLNHIVGKVAEYLLAVEFRTKKRFSLSYYFEGVKDDTKLNIQHVRLRLPIQRENGKNMEVDITADSSCERTVLVEVKKWKTPIDKNIIEDFWEKIGLYSSMNPDRKVLAAFLSTGGFTKSALEFCEDREIAFATKVRLKTGGYSDESHGTNILASK